jgi:drug/metabolite transporter (DMT)-like permease
MNSTSILCAFLSAVLMGTIGVFSKITGLSAEVITFARLILGAVFMLVFLLAIRKMRLALSWPSWPVVVSGCFLAGFIIFYVQAMNFTSMANAIMLVYLAPLVASVAAHFFLNERLTLLSYGLILLALFGFAMMLEFRVELSRQSSEFIGICLGALALLCYAGFILVNRIIPQQIHVYTRAFYQLLVGALVMIPFMLPSVNEIRSEHLIWLAGTGLFPGFLAILFAVMALSRLPAATFGTIAYIEPVAVVIFGWTIFNESLSALQLAGCLLIILSGIGKTLVESSGASLPET